MHSHFIQAILLRKAVFTKRSSRAYLIRFFTAIVFGTALSVSALAEPKGLLETIHRHKFLTSTMPANGDVNPYAIAVVPASVGVIEKDDVLVDNFNNISNLQGTGTTIIRYRPSTRAMEVCWFLMLMVVMPQPGQVRLLTVRGVIWPQ